MFHSWDVFLFQTITSTYKVVASWRVLASKLEYIFECILQIVGHIVKILGEVI